MQEKDEKTVENRTERCTQDVNSISVVHRLCTAKVKRRALHQTHSNQFALSLSVSA